MRKYYLTIVVALLVCLWGCARQETAYLDVFYTADAEGFYHSRPEPRFENRVAGGYGILKSFLNRQQGSFLLFDGGNWFGSTPASALTQGAYVASFLKNIPYSAVSLSDKDFTYGWPALRGTVRELGYPVLVSNLKLDNQIPWPLHDYQIFTQNGIKIGVFGLVSPTLIENHKTRLTGFTIQDPIQTAKEMVSLLQSKGVDFIILLSSLEDNTADTPAEAVLAEEVPGINLLLSADKDREGAETDQINQTYIVYPGARLDSISHLRILFDRNNQVKDISFEDVPLLQDLWGEDETLAVNATRLEQETQKKLNARISQTDQEIKTSLIEESALGDLLADCLHKWAKLDGVVLNSDSIRSSLPSGVITEYDLYKMYPYGDNITFLTMRGAAFIKAMEFSLDAKDNFPQIAGFTVEYNPQGSHGERIKKITLKNGRIIRPQETYRFAVTDHVLAGGLGHDYFIDSLEFKNTFVDARQIMRACLVRQKKVELPKMNRWKTVK
ncbi:MAG: bifunctional metallophosphatase/5'-nucleotidase [Elusimicrobiaceae bacterium]|nr:bifunctional metallophosphatase/5'-nucleotidase [Elusimicrobiaceae bacterium]